MSRTKLQQGILFVLVSNIFFTAGWSGIKLIGDRLPIFEITFFRGLFSFLIIAPLTIYRTHSLRPRQWRLLFPCVLFGFLGIVSGFYAIAHMPLGNALALANTMPIFVALFSPLFMGEPFHPKIFAVVLIAFIGVCLIVQPSKDILQNASLYALLTGMLIALSVIFLPKLHEQNDTTMISFAFTTFIALAAAFPCFLIYVPPTPFEWCVLVEIGVTISIGQLLSTKAFDMGDASIMAPFGYGNVVLCYIVGLAFWHEVPSPWSLVGAVITVGAGTVIMFLSKRHTAALTP